jgi:hypothetical protein
MAIAQGSDGPVIAGDRRHGRPSSNAGRSPRLAYRRYSFDIARRT